MKIQIGVELRPLVSKAAEELAKARELGPLRATATGIVEGAVQNVRDGEARLLRRCAGDAKMLEFVGRDRKDIYVHSFITHGVSPATAKEIVDALIPDKKS